MMKNPIIKMLGGALAALMLLPTSGFADSISPTSFSASLAVGESVTVRKTVTVTEAPPTDALIDVHFLIDTTGSMGAEISAAKTAAAGILTSLASLGDVASGVGAYGEGAHLAGDGSGKVAPGLVINSDITTSDATTLAAISAITLGVPDGGGDFLERGNDAIKKAVENLTWRPGSNRFVVVLGDAGFKTDITTSAAAAAALGAAGADLVGVSFSSSFSSSITAAGGSVFAASATPGSIASAITTGITAGFDTYSTVTVDDLGGGLPEIGVSTACVSADIGACIGSDAVGAFDRSVDRTFEFDVTFTRLADGDKDFETFALVDGGIVAREADSFKGVPEPGSLALLAMGLLGFGAVARRRRK